MRNIIHALHDIWCSITKRCKVGVDSDPYIEWMRDQEKEAIVGTREIRKRRMNSIEGRYLGGGKQP